MDQKNCRKGFTLVELMVVAAILGILFAIVASAFGGGCAPVNGVKSVTSRYEVIGTVLASPGAKMFSGEGGGQTKYSVRLATDQGRAAIVNCTSAQCSSLREGDRVKLSCFEEVHVGEPNEVECRFDSLL